MKRTLKYVLILVPAVLLLALVITASWLFDTPDGARWLFAQVSRSTSVRISAGKLEGTLAQGLRIEDLRVALPDTIAEVKEFNLRWQSRDLFWGRISIQELTGKNVRVQDNRQETPIPAPPTITWPKLGGIFRHINLEIKRLDIQDVSYRRLAAEPLIIRSFSADVRLTHGTLTLREIVLDTPQAELHGTVVAGFIRPLLRIDANLIPAPPVAEVDCLTVAADLDGARTPDALTGPFSIAAFSRSHKKIDVSGELETGGSSIRINRLRVTRPDHQGIVTGQADVLLTAKSPVIDASLVFNNLDLSDRLPSLTGISGRLGVSGTVRSYHGFLSISKKGTGIQSGRIETNFAGTPSDLVLKSLHGSWLGATLNGSARATWKQNISAQASLQLRQLDPASIKPDWKGSVNLDLDAALRIRNKKPFGTVSLTLLPSQLRDRSVTGIAKASVAGDDIRIQRLDLAGRGFAVRAKGTLAERIDLSIRFSDLSLLIPGSEGDVSLSGWVRRRKNVFSGSILGQAKRVLFNNTRASLIHLRASLDDQEGYPFRFSLVIQNGTYSMMHADSVVIDGAGTVDDHSAEATVRSGAYSINARVTGGYSRNVWKGRIVQLAGTEQREQLIMQTPADIIVSRNAFSLSPVVLSAGGDQRIELAGDFTNRPLSGSVSMNWSKIDISRLNAWLTGMTLAGTTEGSVRGTVLPDQRIEVRGRATLSGANLRRRLQQGELKADIEKAELSILWREQTLEAQCLLIFAKYGRFEGGLSSTLPARLPVALDRNAAVRGFLKGQLRESGTLSFLFPGLIQESRGQVNVDIRVTGTWSNPDLAGGFELDHAGGYFPAAGVHISDVQMKALLTRDHIRIESMKAKSGKGTIEGNATLTLSGFSIKRYEGSLQGDTFQALLLPQTRMVISPKLQFEGDPKKLSVRGEVKVPELLIYGPPKEAPLQPSEDVVIVNQQQEAGGAGQLAMDIEIKLILGDRVIVKAEGADAQLGGEVMLTIRTLQEVRGKGEIAVKKGRYSSYGVSLDIERGRILFADGPIENPGLDILATKTVNDVKAGVIVTGTLKKPIVKLYSQPAMPDADILAYMVLGHPLGQDKEQSSYVMQAAGALLSASQSVALQDQVKQRLGLDTIDVESGGGNVSRSLVTIGKYLSSKLYVSYGRELFTGENLFRLRYKFGKRWELESHSGETSGVDLYYTIQFD